MKSHAVLSLGAGMFGVSGELKVYAPALPAAIRGRFAKLPGVVTPAVLPGLFPSGGS